MAPGRGLLRVAIGAGFVFSVLGFALHAERLAAYAGAPGVDLEAVQALLLSDTTNVTVVELPRIGQEVFVAVTYRINGSNDAITANLRALLDGQPFCAGQFTFTPNDESPISCMDSWTATPGMHTLRWELDNTNKVAESDETNNVAEFTFTVADVDLVAERAYLRTGGGEGSEVSAPVAGQTVYFHVDYQLNGIDMPVNTSITARLDGEIWCQGFLDFDPGADSAVYCQKWVATAGMHTVRWEIDDAQLVSETNEDNNVAALTFTVAAEPVVDLEATRAFLLTESTTGPETTNPAPGEQVFFAVDYNGDPSAQANVSAFIDDELWCFGPIDFLSSGTVVCNGGWTAIEGAHTLRWVIDKTNEIPETNETNNVATFRFRVGAVPECVGDCNGSGTVATDELVRGILIMLGYFDLDLCPAFDRDLSGDVSIDEVVTAVDGATGGCK